MRLAFDPAQGLILVPARLAGPSGDFVMQLALDTGATTTMVSWNAAVILGYDPAAASERVQVTTASGVEYSPRIAVQRIEALGADRKSFPVLCHSLPPSTTVDGVLGLDFLRGRMLTIDFRAGQLSLE